MASIIKIHENLIDRIIYHRKKDPLLFFYPRKKNNKGRLSLGYWFLGNDQYVFLSFWNGRDWKEKVNCIGFVVLADKRCWIELTAQGCPEVVPFLSKLANEEGGFVKDKHKNKWFKYFTTHDYLKEFDYYIKVFKPKVDSLIEKNSPPLISFISKSEFASYGAKAIQARNNQIEFRKINKITRLSWNLKSWRSPSGWLGKSKSYATHEGKHGFGFEEWLFDFSKTLGGYQYGFIRAFETKSQKHSGKFYNLHLYTQNNLGEYYYIGYIKNLEGISGDMSKSIYEEYKSKNWLAEMESTLRNVEADVDKFHLVDPDIFVNVRFRIEDVILHPEMQHISNLDDNITTDRFKLLDYKGSVSIETEPIKDEEDEGNFKNTDPRTRTFNSEQVYDPYHDKMQNAIVTHLRSEPKYRYEKVYIEKSRVDIKAINFAGEWDYFEIKTDTAKRNIREALGQVMEYAYFPSEKRANRLIIIGDNAPDLNTVKYLNYIRNQFSLPITYRYFSWTNLTLSDDY